MANKEAGLSVFHPEQNLILKFLAVELHSHLLWVTSKNECLSIG